MNSSTLVSGLIGALISAALSFAIRAFLDKRSLRDREKRLAYVHVVRISEIVAADIVFRSFLKVMIPDRIRDEIKSKDGSFDPPHILSALFARQFKTITPEKLEELPGRSVIVPFLQSLVEGIDESRLNAEQLSTLPKEAILDYSLFLKYLSHLRGSLLLWISLFDKKDISWVKPEVFHDMWLTLTRFVEHARKLRSALIRSGAANGPEASALLKQQIEKFNEDLLTKMQQTPKIQAAMVEADKHFESLSRSA